MQRNGTCAESSAPIFHPRSAACGIIHLTFGFIRADQVVQIPPHRHPGKAGVGGNLLLCHAMAGIVHRDGQSVGVFSDEQPHLFERLSPPRQEIGKGACGQLHHQYGHRHPDREAQPCPCAGNCKSGGRYHVPLDWCRHPEDVKTTRMNARPLRHGHVQDRLARAFYPAILACWNSGEGQREFAAWQAEQAHHAPSNEKQSVPDGERPVVHIAIVCGFLQGASGGTHPVFFYYASSFSARSIRYPTPTWV